MVPLPWPPVAGSNRSGTRRSAAQGPTMRGSRRRFRKPPILWLCTPRWGVTDERAAEGQLGWVLYIYTYIYTYTHAYIYMYYTYIYRAPVRCLRRAPRPRLVRRPRGRSSTHWLGLPPHDSPAACGPHSATSVRFQLHRQLLSFASCGCLPRSARLQAPLRMCTCRAYAVHVKCIYAAHTPCQPRVPRAMHGTAHPMHMPCVRLQALRCRDTAERFRLAERQLRARHQVLRARSAVAVAVG